jgi:hypothetical protein
MIYKSFTIIGALTLLSAVAYAGPAPKELYNKSIILRWTENRTQRFEYVNRIVNSGAAAMVSIYISGAGNTFIRIHRSAYGGRNVSGGPPTSASRVRESAPGEHPRGFKKMDFAGHSLVMYGQSEGGASRVAVDFDETYKGCTVSVTVGKQLGRTSFSQTSLMGERLEVLSVQTAGFECSIQEGNVFAQ